MRTLGTGSLQNRMDAPLRLATEKSISRSPNSVGCGKTRNRVPMTIQVAILMVARVKATMVRNGLYGFVPKECKKAGNIA